MTIRVFGSKCFPLSPVPTELDHVEFLRYAGGERAGIGHISVASLIRAVTTRGAEAVVEPQLRVRLGVLLIASLKLGDRKSLSP